MESVLARVQTDFAALTRVVVRPALEGFVPQLDPASVSGVLTFPCGWRLAHIVCPPTVTTLRDIEYITHALRDESGTDVVWWFDDQTTDSALLAQVYLAHPYLLLTSGATAVFNPQGAYLFSTPLAADGISTACQFAHYALARYLQLRGSAEFNNTDFVAAFDGTPALLPKYAGLMSSLLIKKEARKVGNGNHQAVDLTAYARRKNLVLLSEAGLAAMRARGSAFVAQPLAQNLAQRFETALGGGQPIVGTVLRQIHHTDPVAFAVWLIEFPLGCIPVTGAFGAITVGARVRVRGHLAQTAHGRQIVLAGPAEEIMPSDPAEIQLWLESGRIAGIGPARAAEIVRVFGVATFQVISSRSTRLHTETSLTPALAAEVWESWEAYTGSFELLGFLRAHSLPAALAPAIQEKFGRINTLAQIIENPYGLLDIEGVGFKTADALALGLGIPPDHPQRLQAALHYCLSEATQAGHIFLPHTQLAKDVMALTNTDAPHLAEQLQVLQNTDRVRTETLPHYGVAVYLKWAYLAETNIADHVARRLQLPMMTLPIQKAIQHLQPGQLTPEQVAAVSIIQHRVAIMTGGPGTGKTTCLRTVVQAVMDSGGVVALAAPTGRAAQRLSEVTGQPATTLHRLLGFDGRSFTKLGTDSQPLRADLLIVDEASMLDVPLMSRLLQFVTDTTHVLLVGDVDQLPSVGPGAVLRDLIEAQVPTARLTQIFRQAAASQIPVNAQRVLHGLAPETAADGGGHFYEITASSGAHCVAITQRIVQERLPAKGFDFPRDIVVLAPGYKGEAGLGALNQMLQRCNNPPAPDKAELPASEPGVVFRVGDRVMATRNDYPRGVFNGNVGQLAQMSLTTGEIKVDLDDSSAPRTYTPAEFTAQFVLAYALSVHKAQGSEYPAVVVVLAQANHFLMYRRLLYTAITRAKRFCVIVAEGRAMSIALNNTRPETRFTALTWRLTRAS